MTGSVSGVAATSGLARTQGGAAGLGGARRPAVGRAGQSRAAACACPIGTVLSARGVSAQSGRRGAPRPVPHGPPAPLALSDVAASRRQLWDPAHAVLLNRAAVPGGPGSRQVSVAGRCAQGAGRARAPSSSDARGHSGATCSSDTPFAALISCCLPDTGPLPGPEHGGDPGEFRPGLIGKLPVATFFLNPLLGEGL